eukprot:GHVO01029172.1.p2 GENE.GHVO01029172.1~~GHVO01029172.1.p2  ORF type:complete len:118 (-),score=18.61 GHVO01029172.1:488-841(-)
MQILQDFGIGKGNYFDWNTSFEIRSQVFNIFSMISDKDETGFQDEIGRECVYVDLRCGSFGQNLFSKMTGTSAFDAVELGVYLVCTVESDIDSGILVNIPETESRRNNQFFGLETGG